MNLMMMPNRFFQNSLGEASAPGYLLCFEGRPQPGGPSGRGESMHYFTEAAGVCQDVLGSCWGRHSASCLLTASGIYIILKVTAQQTGGGLPNDVK
jgi:hypothetical protein